MRQRWLGAASGIFVALLGFAPLSFVAYVTVLMFISHDFKIWPVSVIGFVMFGGVMVMGIRDAMRRWREISKLQQVLDSFSDQERDEFFETIKHSDVELRTDETGRTHVLPMDH